MKALTVCQPWAWAIIAGRKRIENRSWRTSYRGRLAIHAGKSRQWLKPDDTMLPDGTHHPPIKELAFGAVIGTVELIDVVPVAEVADDSFAMGPWCWVFSNPRPMRIPFQFQGSQKLFQLPDNSLSE